MKAWMSKEDAFEFILNYQKKSQFNKTPFTSFEEALRLLTYSHEWYMLTVKQVEDYMKELHEIGLIEEMNDEGGNLDPTNLIAFTEAAFTESQIAFNFIKQHGLEEAYHEYSAAEWAKLQPQETLEA